jgi:tetratricopeptide (TPR) repeat protein
MIQPNRTRILLLALAVVSLALSSSAALAVDQESTEPATPEGTVAPAAGEQDEQPQTDEAEKKKKPFWKRILPKKKDKAERAEKPRTRRAPARKERRGQQRLEHQAGAGSSARYLDRVQARLRIGPVGKDTEGRRFLDRIDRGDATAAHYNEFGNYLAQRGSFQDALEYQRHALRLEPNNANLWLNLGTVQRQTGDLSAAAAAFRKAIDLDPNNAFAHYSLGTVYDLQDRYDAAVDAYVTALTLDPSLADPDVNPQVVNNERLAVVKLLLYERRGGAQGLPLISVPRE